MLSLLMLMLIEVSIWLAHARALWWFQPEFRQSPGLEPHEWTCLQSETGTPVKRHKCDTGGNKGYLLTGALLLKSNCWRVKDNRKQGLTLVLSLV